MIHYTPEGPEQYPTSPFIKNLMRVELGGAAVGFFGGLTLGTMLENPNLGTIMVLSGVASLVAAGITSAFS